MRVEPLFVRMKVLPLRKMAETCKFSFEGCCVVRGEMWIVEGLINLVAGDRRLDLLVKRHDWPDHLWQG